MESSSGMTTTVLMMTILVRFSSQDLRASENPIAVDHNVTLHSTTHIPAGIWSFNGHMIVFIAPGLVDIRGPWKTRATYNDSTSSLTIGSLNVLDSGLYSLQSTSHRSDITLSVQVPVSNVTLWANATNLVEYNDTAVLMCSISEGTNVTYEWLKNNSVVTADGNVQLSNGNAKLTIQNVSRFDDGPFICNASNGINHEASQPVHLNIRYGPSNVILTVWSTNEYIHKTGTNITLSCSAESSPPATIQWMFNGAPLNRSASELTLENITESQSGNYQCLLHNMVTGRFSSANISISTLSPITSVVVNATEPAILGDSFTQQCDVTGAFDSIMWWKDGSRVHPDNTTEIDSHNRTLTVHQVQHSHGGDYQCHAFNAVSDLKSSPRRVMVNFGPEMPRITGLITGKTGHNVTFMCNATSYPPSHYEWYFNDDLVSNMSEYVTPELTMNSSGNYRCIAFNSVTGRNSSSYIDLEVTDPIRNVEIEADGTPIEGRAFNLSCRITGPPDLVYWMKDGVMMHEDNTTSFSMENQTVMLQQLHHSYSGDYQCKAINSYGNLTSPVHRLIVNYGPETPVIYGPESAKTGSDAVFNCSALSEPPSTYKWMYNENIMAHTPYLKLYNLTLNMSGEYTCVAHNNVTGGSSHSTRTLTVFEAVKSARILSNGIPILNENFTLICDIDGPYDTMYWMKDNKTLQIITNLIIPFYMNTTDMNSSDMNSTDMNSSDMNSTHMNSSDMNSSDMNSTHMNSTHMNSTHMNSSDMKNSINMNSTHMNSTYMNSTHMNSTHMNSTHMNSSDMNSTHLNSSDMNSTHMNNTDVNSSDMNTTYDLNITSHPHYYFENNMLHLTPVMMESNGAYHCGASNRFSSKKSSEYNLLVIYGPLNVSISGPESAPVNSSVTLNCSAASQPESSYNWYLDDYSNPIGDGPFLTFTATDDVEGYYICYARNPVTNITMSADHLFESDAFVLMPSRASVMLITLLGLSATQLL